MYKNFLTLFLSLFLWGSMIWAQEVPVHDENRNKGALKEIDKLQQEEGKWQSAAKRWQDRNAAVGFMGPYMRTGKFQEGDEKCPENAGEDEDNNKITYEDQPNLRATVNMIEKCHKNEYEQEFESFTMTSLLRSLREPLNNGSFEMKMKYRWPFPKNSHNSPDFQEERQLNFSKMAHIEQFRDYVQRYLTVVPSEAWAVPARAAVEERQLARRHLKQDTSKFLFGDSLTNHNLTAENDWRYDRGVQILDRTVNLREEMQGLNFVTIQLLSEGARSLEVMGASLGKLAMDGLTREENDLFNKALTGQGG